MSWTRRSNGWLRWIVPFPRPVRLSVPKQFFQVLFYPTDANHDSVH